jgi:hypothetical protein
MQTFNVLQYSYNFPLDLLLQRCGVVRELEYIFIYFVFMRKITRRSLKTASCGVAEGNKKGVNVSCG